MFDFSTLTGNYVLLVWVACLIIGYCIKHASFLKKIPNDDIPVILTVVGAVLNIFVSGFTAEALVYGALTGLASTGAHQAFTNFINNKTE